MRLTTDNTAIVLDSTADLPDAAQRFPNWRVVPLYVNFGTDSYRDGVDLTAQQFYARLRTSNELPTTSQPTPADFLAAYEALAGYERILSIHIAGAASLSCRARPVFVRVCQWYTVRPVVSRNG